MPTKVSEKELYRLVEKKAELDRKKLETRAFYLHFALYSVVNIVLAIVWRVTGSSFPWFAFPAGIWGGLIVLHFVAVSRHAGRRRRSREWVRIATEKEVKRLKKVGMTADELERLKEAGMTADELKELRKLREAESLNGSGD